LGLTAPKTYQSHFWHVKEEYVWPLRVARCRRDMALGPKAGCRWRIPAKLFGAGNASLRLVEGRLCDLVKDEVEAHSRGGCATEYTIKTTPV